jgi:hypothetical protein
MSEALARKKSRRKGQPCQQEDKATLRKILGQELASLAREANSDFLAKETGQQAGHGVVSVREGLLARLAADFESAQEKEVLARFVAKQGSQPSYSPMLTSFISDSGLSESELVLVTATCPLEINAFNLEQYGGMMCGGMMRLFCAQPSHHATLGGKAQNTSARAWWEQRRGEEKKMINFQNECSSGELSRS